MKFLWNASHYWPVWLTVSVGAFLVREIWALQTRRSQDTLSEWVWRILKVGVNKPLGDWSAAHFLVFGSWLVLFGWLTFHFFFRRFA